MLRLSKKVRIQTLIDYAAKLNEEIHLGVNPEYTRGQVELIIDAAGLPQEDEVKRHVHEAIAKASSAFFNHESA